MEGFEGSKLGFKAGLWGGSVEGFEGSKLGF